MLSILGSTTLQEIKEFVTTAKEKRPDLESRIDKALYLILMREFKVTSATTVEIQSEEYKDKFYTLTDGKTCTCHDFKHRGTAWCKHRLALLMVTRLEEITQKRVKSTEDRLQAVEELLKKLMPQDAPAPNTYVRLSDARKAS